LVGDYIYFSSNGLKRVNVNTNEVTPLTDCNPFFIATDGSSVFYANWNSGGRIYRYSNRVRTRMTNDVGINLQIAGNTLWFDRVPNNGMTMTGRISPSAEGVFTEQLPPL